MTSKELRASRLLLEIDQARLAELSHVSASSIKRFEGGARIGKVHQEALRRAMEKLGAVFIPEGAALLDKVAGGGVMIVRIPPDKRNAEATSA